MKIIDIVNKIEKLYDKSLMLDFDNSGLNIMTTNSYIKNMIHSYYSNI